MAHIRQSRPDTGRGFQVKALKIVEVFPPSLGSGILNRLLLEFRVSGVRLGVSGLAFSVFQGFE